MPRFPEEITILPEFLVRTARIWPEREAYRWYDYPTNGWVSVTWREFSERVLRWRKAFARMGLKKGDKVSMLLPSSIDAPHLRSGGARKRTGAGTVARKRHRRKFSLHFE